MTDLPTRPTLPVLANDRDGAGAVFVAAYLASLHSTNSKRNMARYIDMAAHVLTNGERDAHSLHWPAVGYAHLVGLQDALSDRYAPNTINGILSAVKGVLRAAWLSGGMNADEYHRATAIKVIRTEHALTGQHLPPAQVRDVLDAAKAVSVTAPRRSARDYAILSLLFGAGLRRSELVALDVWDYDGALGRVQIRKGKGRKDRVTFANVEARRALLAWLEVRAASNVTDTPALFVRVTHHDTPASKGRLSPEAIYKLVGEYGRAAGLVGLTPHDARRTYIGTALDAGVTEGTIGRAVGHASADTTRRYDRRGERAIAEMADKVRY